MTTVNKHRYCYKHTVEIVVNNNCVLDGSNDSFASPELFRRKSYAIFVNKCKTILC